MEQNKVLTGPIHTRLIALAAPLLAGNILQQCYNLVDSWMIGRFLGENAFAAVGVAGTVMNLLIFILNGFCAGISVIFGTLYGAGDLPGYRREAFTAAAFGSGFTLVFSGVGFCLCRPLLALIRTPAELREDAAGYLGVICLGLLATWLYNLLSVMLQSAGHTLPSLAFLAIATALNVGLDYLFLVILPLGTAGAALATVIAQVISALCCLGYLRRRHRELVCTAADRGLHRELLAQTLQYGFASALQTAGLYIGKLAVQGSVNLLGTASVAAFTAASRLEGFINSFGDSGAAAMSVLISQNRGAGNLERVRRGLREGLLLHIAASLVTGAALFLLAEWGVGLFVSSRAALEAGTSYLRWIAPFYVLCFIGCCQQGFFRGIGRLYVPAICSTGHIAIRCALAYWLTAKIGLPGLAIATGVGWVGAVVYQFWEERRPQTQAILKP